MTQEELIPKIMNDVEALANSKKVEEVHKWASWILKKARDLESIDQEVFLKFQNALVHLARLNPDEVEYVPLATEEALKNLRILESKLKSPAPNFLKTTDRRYEPNYLKARSKYASNEKAILGTEEELFKTTDYMDKLHGIITSGKFQGCRHARITENLRIFYHVEGEFLVFDDILTKNDFDKIN